MKILNVIPVIVPCLLAISWPAQGENFALDENGRVPGKPFEALQQQINDLQQQVAELRARLASVSVDSQGDLVVTGVNLRILNGLGGTSCGPPFTPFDCNGKGNLIVGYDEDIGGDSKTGSHNLVIGSGHTYTSYNGIVSGRNNEISAVGATVLNGIGNVASGNRATIVSGRENLASGRQASIGGGSNNIASGDWSSVSGGNSNLAEGEYTTVGGGLGRATGIGDIYAWTAGGLFEPF